MNTSTLVRRLWKHCNVLRHDAMSYGDYVEQLTYLAHKESLRRMRVPVNEPRNVGGFSEGQKRYLEFHRESVFLAANLRA